MRYLILFLLASTVSAESVTVTPDIAAVQVHIADRSTTTTYRVQVGDGITSAATVNMGLEATDAFIPVPWLDDRQAHVVVERRVKVGVFTRIDDQETTTIDALNIKTDDPKALIQVIRETAVGEGIEEEVALTQARAQALKEMYQALAQREADIQKQLVPVRQRMARIQAIFDQSASRRAAR